MAQKQTLPTQGPKAGKWQSWDLNAASLCPEPQNCTTSPERGHFLARENATCSSPTSQELAQDEFPAVHTQSLLSLLSRLIALHITITIAIGYLKGAAVLKTQGRNGRPQGPPRASAGSLCWASRQVMSLQSPGLGERRQCVAATGLDTQVNP